MVVVPQRLVEPSLAEQALPLAVVSAGVGTPEKRWKFGLLLNEPHDISIIICCIFCNTLLSTDITSAEPNVVFMTGFILPNQQFL